MTITSTELKQNLSKYLSLAEKEDILVTKNNIVIAKIANPHQDKLAIMESLFGSLPKEASLEEARMAASKRYGR